ncbi:SDR family NAD(P)-dependent oxidoreductase [Chromohalobacter israelensis]|uniref:SDR family NAD(P)-dependent oxidoreductase n=1 Tax=Chromohalobacter israelensis TaxID=141390 RepID=UPI0005537CFA|nr:SDR family oxidoreductase [Chromohalobacter israelensis]MDF9434136.1 SDR family oxidoreductase [Chromohalobacter israelensis]
MNLTDQGRKVALITGGLGGIGSSCAQLFAEQGYRVIITSRDQRKIDEMSLSNGSEAGSIEGVAVDLNSHDERLKLLERIPTPNVLVNNAGLNIPKPFLEVQPEDFDDVFAVNVKALFFLTQAVIAKMIEEKRAGSIVNISSQAGLTGLFQRTVYCASKHAVEGFTKALAVDLKGYGIRVNNVAPTFVETEMTRATLSQESFRQHIQDKLLLDDLPVAEDIADAVWFLATEHSRSITGTTLKVDAGWTAH